MPLRLRNLFSPLAVLLVAAILAPGARLLAQAGQFDLLGPTLEVKVNRAGRTLPIAEVPSLAVGDRIWLHPVLSDNQSIHYLMIAAFLRGSTNPPPDEWFTKAETWNKKILDEGIYVTVPPGAQQVVVFLAPETNGDFSTLKNAVRGRPGSFVRASQDLNEASFDRARIDTYLAALKDANEPAKVKEETSMLARSLALKVDQQCFDRETDQQAPCLMQNQDQMILDNGRSQSIATSLTNGPAGDLALQAGNSAPLNAGYYNAYIAAGMDIARILDSLHTAQYQYIPALSSDDDLTMKLRLNTPPSFHNPKSVIVIALPPVASPDVPPSPPSLHPVDEKQTLCMEREPLVLPVEGAPAVFATQFAHGLTIHLEGKDGKNLDLPVNADPSQGGFVVPSEAVVTADLGSDVKATVHGFWGFQPYTGPIFQLESTVGTRWGVANADANALVVGREDELHLTSPSAACVDDVKFRDASGKEATAAWKLTKPDEITAKLPLKDAQPGEVTIEIAQAGSESGAQSGSLAGSGSPTLLKVVSFSEAGKLESFSMHAGDPAGTLKGTRLDEVAKLMLDGRAFTPEKLTRTGSSDELTLALQPGSDGKSATAQAQKAPSGLLVSDRPGAAMTLPTAVVTLKDGRHLDVAATIMVPRPQVTLLNKSVQLPASPPQGLRIQLAGEDELPLDGKLTFALKSQSPAIFARGESIEIATADGMSSVTLKLSSADLVLQDAKTAIATLDPMKSFGNSAFGVLQLRPVSADGSTGDWQKLATLVRLPTLTTLTCPPDVNAPCELAGSSLFLIDSVAADAQFTRSMTVPDGFAGSTLEVPHTTGSDLYLKLRDNPTVVNTVELQLPGPSKQARAARQNAHKPGETTDAAPPAPGTGVASQPAAKGVPAVPAALTSDAPSPARGGSSAAAPVAPAVPMSH
jgi:hypothetical protein